MSKAKAVEAGFSLVSILVGATILAILATVVSLSVSRNIAHNRDLRVKAAFQGLDPLVRTVALDLISKTYKGDNPCVGLYERMKNGWKTYSLQTLQLEGLSGNVPGNAPPEVKSACATSGTVGNQKQVFCLRLVANGGGASAPAGGEALDGFALVAVEHWDAAKNQVVTCDELMAAPARSVKMMYTLFWKMARSQDPTYFHQSGAAMLPVP